MGHLQILLRAAFTETLYSTEAQGLSQDQQSKLGNAAALLFTKVQRRKTPSVLQNQITCIQEVTQAISEDVCWKRLLDELIETESLTQTDRDKQCAFLGAQLDYAAFKIKMATDKAKEYALFAY
jgi:poly-beta-hydroxyalkanoate depolymerase